MDDRNLGISSAMIEAALALKQATQHEAGIKIQVEAYQRSILERHQFFVSPEFNDEPRSDKRIVDPNRTWLMSDADHAVYVKECMAERDRLGLPTRHPENCPLLEAQSSRVAAELALFNALAHHPRLGHLKAANEMPSPLRQKALELAINFMARFIRHLSPSHPFQTA